MDVRPYQLMCLVCRMGRQDDEEYYHEERLDEIYSAVQANPGLPLCLRCNVDAAYAFQNPGRQYDTPEGELFNDRRDLNILQRTALVPGDTRPARDALRLLVKNIETTKDICAFDEVTAEHWQGCRFGHSGNYERGHEGGLNTLLGAREPEEKASVKETSCREMAKAEILCIRPHHLMCMTCFHKGRPPAELEPIQEDNLCEAIDICRKNPEIPIKLIAGPCMICPPCSGYDKSSDTCVASIAMSLRDEKKDLDVLQRLGMEYGDVLPARELLRLLFERVHSTTEICGNKDDIERSPEWRVCRSEERFQKGRTVGLGIPGVRVTD